MRAIFFEKPSPMLSVAKRKQGGEEGEEEEGGGWSVDAVMVEVGG